MDLLEPRDATAVYKRAHRAAVGILHTPRLRVGIRPIAGRMGKHISIERFVRYKSLVRQAIPADGIPAIDTFIEDLNIWASSVECEGEQDPRCMPLHVFDDSRDWLTLDGPAGRTDFKTAYGAGTKRDREGREWQRARVLHTREVLTVAGKALAVGFHWDVQNLRNSPARVSTTNEVFELLPFGYVNVHPDAFVRGERKARRIWPRP